jgi:hypothetical protein
MGASMLSFVQVPRDRVLAIKRRRNIEPSAAARLHSAD